MKADCCVAYCHLCPAKKMHLNTLRRLQLTGKVKVKTKMKLHAIDKIMNTTVT